jgi:hypothetical protein
MLLVVMPPRRCTAASQQVNEILADGVITTEERVHLQDMLQQLVGGTLEDLANSYVTIWQRRIEIALPCGGGAEVAFRSQCVERVKLTYPGAACKCS